MADALISSNVGGSISNKAIVKDLRAVSKLKGYMMDVVMNGRISLCKTFGKTTLMLDLEDPVAISGCEHVEGVFE